MRIRSIAGLVFLSLLLIAALWSYLAARGYWGARQSAGELVQQRRDDSFVENKKVREQSARLALGLGLVDQSLPPGKHILFGDLHAHTDWSDGAGSLAEMAAAARERHMRHYLELARLHKSGRLLNHPVSSITGL